LHPSAESELISTRLVPPVPRAGLIARAGLLQQRSRMLASASRRQAEPQAPLSEREQAVLRLLPTPADGARDISPR
jgi:ATP/maltotriose-dependent transcriptional regulator MalT